jgi:hypothetical protein
MRTTPWFLLACLARGVLDRPPGPPEPTFKTLQQAEPRRDLQVLYQGNHDAVADATTTEIVIRDPGSYYVTSNLDVTCRNGIFVGQFAGDVTSISTASEFPASIGCTLSDCAAYRNGGDGIEIRAGRTRVINYTVFGNAGHGIHSASASNRNFIEGCLAHSTDAFGGFGQVGAGDAVIKNQGGGNRGGAIYQGVGNIVPIQAASPSAANIHPLENFP